MGWPGLERLSSAHVHQPSPGPGLQPATPPVPLSSCRTGQKELRELESLRTSSGGAGVGAAGASANIGAGSIIPVLGGLGQVGVAAGNRRCVWQQVSLALCGRHC